LPDPELESVKHGEEHRHEQKVGWPNVCQRHRASVRWNVCRPWELVRDRSEGRVVSSGNLSDGPFWDKNEPNVKQCQKDRDRNNQVLVVDHLRQQNAEP